MWLFFQIPTKTFLKNWWFRSKISLWFQSLILGVRLPCIFKQGTESTVLVHTVIINRWIHLLAPLTRIFFYHWLYWELQDLTTLQKFWNCQVEMWFFAFGNFRKFAVKNFFVMYLWLFCRSTCIDIFLNWWQTVRPEWAITSLIDFQNKCKKNFKNFKGGSKCLKNEYFIMKLPTSNIFWIDFIQKEMLSLLRWGKETEWKLTYRRRIYKVFDFPTNQNFYNVVG